MSYRSTKLHSDIGLTDEQRTAAWDAYIDDPNATETPDFPTEAVDDYVGQPVAWLDHSCGEWVIGGEQEIRAMIRDLQAILDNPPKPKPRLDTVVIKGGDE